MRTNKRAAAAHHGKCQTLMLSARGKETEIKEDEFAGGWVGEFDVIYTIDIPGNRYTPHSSVHNRDRIR